MPTPGVADWRIIEDREGDRQGDGSADRRAGIGLVSR